MEGEEKFWQVKMFA